LIGKTLGVRYEIIALVSETSMFKMYSARDRLTGRNVGIREFKPPFNNESKFISAVANILPSLQISHPSLEFIHELVEEESQHFLISEMPKGSLLSERIKRFAPFTVPVALSTIQGIVEGLDVLHQQGIAHGDVGSHNIIATHDGSAKLQLGGFWRTYSSSSTAGASVLAQMAPYLAPEVCQGATPSASSDLYGVGVILFHLLIGSPPFQGESPTATTMRHLQSPVPSLRGLNASIPVAVEQLVNKLLSKNPMDRYRSAKELLVDLNQISDQLRFGKSPGIKKPVENTAPVVEPAPSIRPEKPDKEEQRKLRRQERTQRKQERDVPGWLLGVMAIALLGAVGTIVAFVVFLAQKPRELKMPNIVGAQVQQAKDDLKKMKLNLKVVSKESNDRVDMNRILKSSPPAGQPVREGGTVDVVVSSGSRTVAVPNLLGFTADEAKEALGSLNLLLDGKPARIVDFDQAPGTILRQLPEPNKVVTRFSKVRIWIAARSDSAPGSLPGESETNAGNTARSFMLRHTVKGVNWKVTVRVEIEDESGPRNVYQKDHDPGDTVIVREIGYGTKATFRVYYDDELQETKEVLKQKTDGVEGNSPPPNT
jgi:eukaryotic-like serine/threonine-protein kinase